MISFLERHKRIFLLAGVALCVVAIVLTINPSAGSGMAERGVSRVVTPMQRGASAAIGWVRGNFTVLANNRRLLDEINSLREENTILRIENDRLQLAGDENATLNALFDMRQRYGHLPTIGARVIGHSPNDWHRRFFLDRGTEDGVAGNMAVIGDGGLLGVVRQVDAGRSQFVSIIDSEFSVAVMTARTGDIGMVSGDIRLMQQGLIRMERIEAAAQIIPGDEIRTSTHSSIFPPGILVGVIESIHPNPDGHTRHAIVRPAVVLDNIEMVLIVTAVFGDATALRDDFVVILEGN
ncbi:MAG: rod shape-determining protein MreC [Defluviitaleaceae bacterium]|nr:rod shape-determining protein MreC [Defluviitaleaceae bacterium]